MVIFMILFIVLEGFDFVNVVVIEVFGELFGEDNGLM